MLIHDLLDAHQKLRELTAYPEMNMVVSYDDLMYINGAILHALDAIGVDESFKPLKHESS